MQVNAQTWFPVGAEWTYTIVYPQSDISFRTIKINCLRDTNIQGIDARILTEGSACSGCKSENIFYYDSTDDIVYQYIIDQFKPYLDFSKNAGETYYLYFYNMDNYPGEFCDSILLEVDSVVTHQIMGKNIRYQYIKRVNDDFHYFNGPIIEFMGSASGFYPEYGACDHSVFSGLRCYADTLFTYYADPIFEEKGCDYDVSIKAFNKQQSLTLYPNPANNQLTLDNGQAIMNEIQIFNLLGKEVKHFQLNDTKVSLDINDLPKGFYFLHILTDKGMINKSFVKE
jgi:hypothetical protein